MPYEQQENEQKLVDDMFEKLSDTPLMRQVVRLDQDGDEELVTINETQRVFWAIDFIDKFGKERGLKGIK